MRVVRIDIGRASRRALCLSALGLLVAPSAQAGKFVFASVRCSPCVRSIWTVNDDGSDPRRLTADGADDYYANGDHEPAWAPDGRQIAYVRRDNVVREDNGIRIMDAEGGSRRWVITEESGIPTYFLNSPDWSPDGRTIVFGSPSPSAWPNPHDDKIYAVDTDGSNLRLVADGPGEESAPQFVGPDRIHYTCSEGQPLPISTTFERCAVNLDGSELRKLTLGGAGRASYSSDGAYVALVFGGELWTMRADGSALRTWNRGGELGSRLVWNRDDTVFFAAAPGLGRPPYESLLIHRLDLARRDPRPEPITQGPGFDLELDWSDGAPLFASPRDRTPPAVFLTDPRGRLIRNSFQRRAASGPKRPREVRRGQLGFVAVDQSGVRRVEGFVARGVLGTRRRCRFLGRAGFGRLRTCSRPVYRRVHSEPEWRRLQTRLKPGLYSIGLRSTDVHGHHSKRVRWGAFFLL